MLVLLLTIFVPYVWYICVFVGMFVCVGAHVYVCACMCA